MRGYQKAKLHFKKTDPKLYRAATEFDISDISKSEDLFQDLVWTIIGQQLSGKAADTIFGRFQKLFRGGIISPKRILALKDSDMRKSGLSGAKAKAIKNLAKTVQSRELVIEKLSSMKDEEILSVLTKIKGIGPWTAEMILMFSLGREDVFSKGDLGLQKGLVELYGLRKFPSDEKLIAISKRWSPYRTYAARVLWKVADRKSKRIGRKRVKK